MKSIFQKHFCLCMPVTGMVLVKRFNNLLWGYLVLSKRPTLEIMTGCPQYALDHEGEAAEAAPLAFCGQTFKATAHLP